VGGAAQAPAVAELMFFDEVADEPAPAPPVRRIKSFEPGAAGRPSLPVPRP
jgi:hypothetical protein